MTRNIALRMSAALVVVAGGVITAQQTSPQLPSAPPRQFGASISPAYEGWFDNPDGSHNFVIGYFSRNTEAEMDVPIGPNNRFEPGPEDAGQPTHFLPRRHFGMFVVTVPKEFGTTQKISWTLSVNGETTTIPFHLQSDYRISALQSTEEAGTGLHNRPPSLRFTEAGTGITGPFANPAKAIERSATVGTPMPLDMWSEDDGVYTSGSNSPLSGERSPVTFLVTKYRGPGDVKVNDVKLTASKGGKPMDPYAGKGSTTVTFSAPGDYMLHVQANDYSGQGGGGTGCCWTTAILKVAVAGVAKTNGQ